MKDNISGIRQNGVRKPPKKQVVVKQANKTTNNGGANDQTMKLKLSDYANNVCQMMKAADLNGHANCDTARLTEPDDQGLFEFKDSGKTGSAGQMVFLESLYFYNDLIEEYISAGLKDKMKRDGASFVAIELGLMINSFTNKNGETIEERAVNREIGTRLASYFAKVFIDDPVRVRAFMDGITGYAQRDMMLEKGYYFWEGQAYEIYKPVPISIFFNHRNARWSNETVAAFEANEKKVTDAIDAAVTALDNDTVTGRLEQILAKYGLTKGFANKDDVQNGAQWTAGGDKRLYA